MANEIGPISYDSGADLSVVLFDASGNVWDASAAEWTAVEDATFADCLIVLVESGTSGLYYADMPFASSLEYSGTVYLDTATGFNDDEVADFTVIGAATSSSGGLTQAQVVALARIILNDPAGSSPWWTDAHLGAFALAFLNEICSARAELRYGIAGDEVDFSTVTVPPHLLGAMARETAGCALQMEGIAAANPAKGAALRKEARASAAIG